MEFRAGYPRRVRVARAVPTSFRLNPSLPGCPASCREEMEASKQSFICLVENRWASWIARLNKPAVAFYPCRERAALCCAMSCVVLEENPSPAGERGQRPARCTTTYLTDTTVCTWPVFCGTVYMVGILLSGLSRGTMAFNILHTGYLVPGTGPEPMNTHLVGD